jgi:hypothetical protein
MMNFLGDSWLQAAASASGGDIGGEVWSPTSLVKFKV